MRKQPKYVYGLYNKARTNDYKSSADKLKIIVSTQYKPFYLQVKHLRDKVNQIHLPTMP